VAEKPEHRSLTPRPGWTQEQEYIALSEEFFAVEEERDRLAGAVDPVRESRIARARGLAQAIAECRDNARLDGIREGAAEIVTLLER